MIDHDRLRKLRKEKGWTLSQVAAYAGMDRSHLGEIELGKRLPKLDTLSSLLVAYGYELVLTAVRESGESTLTHRLI